jgi:hypothetical protein
VDLATESDLKEGEDLFGNGSRPSDHHTDPASKDLSELLEDQGIVEFVS